MSDEFKIFTPKEVTIGNDAGEVVLEFCSRFGIQPSDTLKEICEVIKGSKEIDIMDQTRFRTEFIKMIVTAAEGGHDLLNDDAFKDALGNCQEEHNRLMLEDLIEDELGKEKD